MILPPDTGAGRLNSAQRHHFTRFARVAIIVTALCSVAVQVGCETNAMRTYRGARHFSAGNDALARENGARAIVELEQAAALVPHASEIQNHLGLAYWSEGRLQAARLSFERALELDCENEAAEANLETLRTAVTKTELGIGVAVGNGGYSDGG